VAGRHAGGDGAGDLLAGVRRRAGAAAAAAHRLAHGGGAFPWTLGRIDHAYHVRPDLCATAAATCPRGQLGRLYFDSLVHDAEALRYLIALAGADRVALGTDYPFPLGEAEPGKLIESLTELTDAQRYRLLAGTALEFLGLDPP
jgi:aminocarboxymuconate-semialdehyde decarboxylase